VKNKITILLCFLFFSCSSSNQLSKKIWNNEEKKIKPKNIELLNFKNIEKTLSIEVNKNLNINISNKIDTEKSNNLKNNIGIRDYDGELKIFKKVKYKKISNSLLSQSDIIFGKNYLIIFDGDGSLIKLDKDYNIIWKKNYYSKLEKKTKPFLFLKKKDNILIVADNISKLYAININNGDLIWSKNHSSAFNSEIKIFGENFFISDLNNLFMSISIKNGVENWSFQSEDFFIKTLNKASVVADNKTVYFLNTIGDLTALDIKSGFLKWQISNQNNNIFDKHFLNKNSKLLMDNQLILYSSKNDFYAFDKRNGFLKWKQKIQTTIAPTVIDENLLIISLNGFFVVVDSVTGIIKRSNFIFTDFNKKELKKITPIGFVVGIDKIYLTLNNGKMLIIDVKTGKLINNVKIDNKLVSKPQVYEKKLYIMKNNELVVFK
tara:strand:- start:777 stop:2078 length:1302 start_codon:yes stop_codon:yes gene_type:complete